jgi:hypothetical protein
LADTSEVIGDLGVRGDGVYARVEPVPVGEQVAKDVLVPGDRDELASPRG